MSSVARGTPRDDEERCVLVQMLSKWFRAWLIREPIVLIVRLLIQHQKTFYKRTKGNRRLDSWIWLILLAAIRRRRLKTLLKTIDQILYLFWYLIITTLKCYSSVDKAKCLIASDLEMFGPWISKVAQELCVCACDSFGLLTVIFK